MPAVRLMPRPDWLENARAERLTIELRALIGKYRIPFLKLGDSDAYRQELLSESLLHVLSEPDLALKTAIDRAEQRLRKLYRELRAS